MITGTLILKFINRNVHIFGPQHFLTTDFICMCVCGDTWWGKCWSLMILVWLLEYNHGQTHSCLWLAHGRANKSLTQAINLDYQHALSTPLRKNGVSFVNLNLQGMHENVVARLRFYLAPRLCTFERAFYATHECLCWYYNNEDSSRPAISHRFLISTI